MCLVVQKIQKYRKLWDVRAVVFWELMVCSLIDGIVSEGVLPLSSGLEAVCSSQTLSNICVTMWCHTADICSVHNRPC